MLLQDYDFWSKTSAGVQLAEKCSSVTWKFALREFIPRITAFDWKQLIISPLDWLKTDTVDQGSVWQREG